MSNIQDHPLVQFYLCQEPKPDAVPYLFRHIYAEWGFEELEQTHDYIQWLFPLPERSEYNPDAPVLMPELAKYLKSDSFFQINFRAAQEAMFDFYGFDKALRFNPGRRNLSHWLVDFNHNHLRISRIIRSIKLLDRELRCSNRTGTARAKMVSQCFISAGSTHGVNAKSLNFWADAAK